ncbi:diaminopimelate decarboxylase [Sideroxydans lithotrophicus]|uniref:Diaminopimelate decarboxylase n=1 Tax=Sideroxydans lithotrophicus (strain ES-1) TaxID=580332 RepID=D5CMA2_SIDLE|nr:diaminopimelate decarboxylase [Sideroxydans lithotrophicus]ADE10716.1 diaminopimelate decarboxylase [Sideroxydans lithotrophicus ES-1]
MTEYFHYQQDQLYAEKVALSEIAQRFGTPCYVYSRAALTDSYRQFAEALKSRDHLICYAVKANSNLAILNLFARLGAGFDIVSGGELQRVLAAGGAASKVVFSGVGKSEAEMRQALEAEILCFNVESAPELDRLNALAGSMGKVAPVSLRVNPDVDAKTHPYISTGLKQNKFGVAYTEALELYRKAAAMPNLRVTGMDCHIGSQLTETSPFIAAAEKVLALVDKLAAAGITLEHLDLGGGLGIRYDDETPPSIAEYGKALLAVLQGRSEKLIVEPGRVLVGNAGVLLTRIEYLKHGEEKNFAIVDAAMNDLMRPALYDAWHAILPVQRRQNAPLSNSLPQAGERTSEKSNSQIYEVVGPICETGDFIGHAREMAVDKGDALAVMSAGAYGMSMSSNYNTRPRAAEVMVDGAVVHLVRERETVRQLYASEKIVA